MLYRIYALLCAFALVCSAAHAQAPQGYLTVTESNLLDSASNRVDNATVCAQVQIGGQAASVQVAGSVVNTFSSVCAPVVNGTWSIDLPDMSTAVPHYACVNLTATDNLTGNALISGYSCIQPRSVPPPNIGAAPFWCTPSGCNFDLLPPNYPASDVFTAPTGATGAQGATGCVVGQTCTTALVPKSVGGAIYASGYGAQCVGGDDTAAIQAAINAAKNANAGGTLNSLVLPPGNCRVSQTLDITGLSVQGGGGRTNGITQISPTTTNPNFDMLHTYGTTYLAHLRVNGGWDGTSTSAVGTGFTIIKDQNYGLSAYVVSLDDVWVQSTGSYGILTTDGAYQSFHNLRVSTVGSDAFHVVSGSIPGFQQTTIAFSGQNILSDAHSGYGIVCQACIDVSFAGSVTTSENTKGLLITGDGRNLDLSHLYLEGTIGGKCITTAGSTGIGLVVADDYGPGCVGPTPDDLMGWSSVAVFANDFGVPNYNDGMATVVRSYNYTVNDPQTYRIPLHDAPANAIASTWTTLGIAGLYPGAAWTAKINAVFLDGTTQAKNANEIVLSSAHPSQVVGGVTLTCTIGDGTNQGGSNATTSGQFQCMSTNYAAFAHGPTLLGELTLSVSKQATGNSGVALQTGDSISVGGVTSSGPVSGSNITGNTITANTISGATVTSGNGFSGQCTAPHVPVFTGGIATGCSTNP